MNRSSKLKSSSMKSSAGFNGPITYRHIALAAALAVALAFALVVAQAVVLVVTLAVAALTLNTHSHELTDRRYVRKQIT